MSTLPIDRLPPPGALQAASPARAVQLLSFEKGRANAIRRKYHAWLDGVFALLAFLEGTSDCASFVVLESAVADDTWALMDALNASMPAPDATHRIYAERLAWLVGRPRFSEVTQREQVLPSLLGAPASATHPRSRLEHLRELIAPWSSPTVIRNGVIAMAAQVVCRWLFLEARTQRLAPKLVDELIAAWADAQIDFFAMLDALGTPGAADHIPADRRRSLATDVALVMRRAVHDRQLLQAYDEGRMPLPQLLDDQG